MYKHLGKLVCCKEDIILLTNLGPQLCYTMLMHTNAHVSEDGRSQVITELGHSLHQ